MKQGQFSLQDKEIKQSLFRKATAERKKWMWIVLLGCFLIQMLPYCVALNLTNVFVGSDWRAWTDGNQTMIGLTFTMGALGAAVIGPFVAKLFSRKINMRFVYSIGVIAGMIGFVGSSINGMLPTEARNLPTATAILWISNIVSQGGVMIFSGLGVNNLISKWWPPEKRGFALGIAFTGGSLGNIWMQQLVGKLSEIFGNQPGSTAHPYEYGQQYLTYIIMGSIGLVLGLGVIMFVCRKPIPSISDFSMGSVTSKPKNCVNCNTIITKNTETLTQPLEASPLVTKKYPIYWMIAFGYLILQMGTVHASMNGAFVANATLVANATSGLTYSGIMATGGTLFGVSCLIGNSCGGILNDKLGPNKSIFMAGFMQCAAILCLMLSVKVAALVYIYFILAGLSVYVYTSTPAFISGKLYGAKQSNNHMAILGIFIALGFAIVNSVQGVITGEASVANPGLMFGEKTNGNFQALGIFALVCMAIGTIIVTIGTTIILNKGIKGLLKYSPTKYSKVLFLKHGISVKLSTIRILLTGVDFRNADKWREKIQEKSSKLINNIPNKIESENDRFASLKTKMNDKNIKKLEKINIKLKDAKLATIDAEKNKKNIEKSKALTEKWSAKKAAFESKIDKSYDDWKKYKKDYEFDSRITDAKAIATKLETLRLAKISGLERKLQTNNYIYNFTVQQEQEGHELLNTYYKNTYGVYQQTVTASVEDILERKIDLTIDKAHKIQNKYVKLINKEEKIEKTLVHLNIKKVDSKKTETKVETKKEVKTAAKKESVKKIAVSKPKIVNGISTDKKHNIVKNDTFSNYNYDKRLKDWKKDAGYNKKECTCNVCKETNNKTSILLENNKHICYTCWIKKPKSKK